MPKRYFPRRFALFVCLAVIALLGAGCGSESSTEPAERASGANPRVLVIALDGLEPSLLRRFMEAGTLPHFEQLIDRGSLAEIECVVGSISPVVWTTVATSASPERHGIPDFTINDVPVTSTARRVPAMWNILSRQGLSSAILGWLVSWPAEADSGIIVSDRATWGKFENKIAPPDVIDLADYHRNSVPEDFVGRFTSYPYDRNFETTLSKDDPRYAANFLLKRRLINIYVRDTLYGRIAQEVLERERLDLAAVYFQGSDYVSHGFWKYFDPEPYREAGWEIDDEEVEQLKDIIPKYYAFLDRQIGEILKLISDDTLVVVLSDHGFGTGLGKYAIKGDFLSGNHRNKGVLILSGPAIEKGREQQEQITHFDILPTLLYALDLPLARDHEGQPLLSYFTNSYLESKRITYVDTYADGSAADSTVEASEHDEEILQELKSLGYID